jgi:KTSC domain-containing protein
MKWVWQGEGTRCRSSYRVIRNDGKAPQDKRVRQPNVAPRIPMFRMNSSNIAAVGYDHGLKILRVRFVRGATYDYLEVPAIVYKGLLDAISKGRFVNSQIKTCYAYRRLPKRP